MEQNNKTNEEENLKLKDNEKNVSTTINEDNVVSKKLEDKNIKTTFKKMSQIIKTKLMQLEDMATLELMLPVEIRMKKRIESIKKLSSAKSYKINGHWKTIPPEMHITNLRGMKINNNECEIKFGVYATDEKGNKKEFKNVVIDVDEYGRKRKRHLSSDYLVEYEVTEKISYNKPITREIVYMDNNRGGNNES